MTDSLINQSDIFYLSHRCAHGKVDGIGFPKAENCLKCAWNKSVILLHMYNRFKFACVQRVFNCAMKPLWWQTFFLFDEDSLLFLSSVNHSAGRQFPQWTMNAVGLWATFFVSGYPVNTFRLALVGYSLACNKVSLYSPCGPSCSVQQL